MSCPSTVAVPRVAWRKPSSVRMKVDLPAPFGPEEAEDLAAPNVEGQVGQRSHRAVVLRQRVSADDRVRWRALHGADRSARSTRRASASSARARTIRRCTSSSSAPVPSDPGPRAGCCAAAHRSRWSTSTGPGTRWPARATSHASRAPPTARTRTTRRGSAAPSSSGSRSTSRSSCAPACLWLAHRDDGFEGESLPVLERLGIPAVRLEADALRERHPQIRTDDVAWALHEPEAGVLMARRAVAATAQAVAEEGGEVRIGLARVEDETLLSTACPRSADAVVFAAGPWLPKLLGPVPGLELAVPQQEIIYFATPPGDDRFDAGQVPTWVEYDAAFYGLPSIEGRGFKVAPDWPGPLVDPDTQERRISDERVARVPRLPSAALPGPRRPTGGGGARLPVRADAGHPLHHRPPPHDRRRLDRRRRLGARLQACPSRRGVPLGPRDSVRIPVCLPRRTAGSRSGRESPASGCEPREHAPADVA